MSYLKQSGETQSPDLDPQAKRPYLDVSNAAQDIPENVGYGAEGENMTRHTGQASRVGAGVGTDGGGEGGTSGNWGGDATQDAANEGSLKGHTSPTEQVPEEGRASEAI